MSPIRLAVLTLATVLAAPARATPAADPAGCSATVSGAVKAAFACTVTARVEGKVVAVTITADGAVPGLRAVQPVTVKLAMPLAAGTYSGSALGSAASSLETEAGASYAAGGGKGELTLVVEQAEPYRQLPNHLVLSGSLKARLVPAKAGKGGDALLEVRF